MQLLCAAQLTWQNVDSLYQPLPSSVHVYQSTTMLDGKPNIAYYVSAELNDRNISFSTDTTYKRRLTPLEFFDRNKNAVVVVNSTFFSFATNQNLNLVIKDKKMVGYNVQTINGRGKDTFTYRHPFGSAIGIARGRTADVAWLYTDSSLKHAYSLSTISAKPIKDSSSSFKINPRQRKRKDDGWVNSPSTILPAFKKWKMETAVGGGPVLLVDGEINITNEEELKFNGKAIDDKHPRTAMGYTNDGKLIILALEGRNKGVADGATLKQEAQILKDIGCVEALNLDGGGSSCLLVNGKPTIKVSDAAGQRAVPAVFIIKRSR